MHQAILGARRAQRRDRQRAAALRFIRSSSASLPPQVMARAGGDLPLPGDRGLRHDRGGAPDGVATRCRRGDAQAGHGRAMPPGPRSRSWTRPAACCRRRDRRGRDPRAQRDAGYENNPEANADGLRRTAGSAPATRAVLDEDGYLRLTGRLKEIINRGGEKISPARGRRGADGPSGGRAGRHLRHAARQARRGGRRGGRAARGRRRRPSASCATSRPTRLADFKVPRKIVILDEIPKGADRQAAAHRPGRRSSGLGVMRICVFGAGAIGGLLAARSWRRAGADVDARRARPAPRGDAGERARRSQRRRAHRHARPRPPTIRPSSGRRTT